MTNEKMLELLKAEEYNKLHLALLENIRADVEKSKGSKASDLSIIKRITEYEKKMNNNRWAFYHPFTHDGIEYKGFLQGHYILASQNDFGYPMAENPMKLSQMFDVENDIEIDVNIADLKVFIKSSSKKDFKPYVMEYTTKSGEDKKIGFNAKYLLDGLQFNETTIIKISQPKAPAIIENKEKKTIGLILPVNLPKSE
jgi:hypothetical protein